MKRHFFLGGWDLEMVTIARLLDEVAPQCYTDHGLGWGARASAYRHEIQAVVSAHICPVLVELEDDLGLTHSGAIIVDHHGAGNGDIQPTSLQQVFSLLGLPSEKWTRWFELVAANDRGHVRSLIQVGATQAEIREVRAADRAAQRITVQEEHEGERAARSARSYADGKLLVVELPHSRTATVTDCLHSALGGPGYTNLLIASPGEVNFFGTGDLVRLLAAHDPAAWCGGDSERGFWGSLSAAEPVLTLLLSALNQHKRS